MCLLCRPADEEVPDDFKQCNACKQYVVNALFDPKPRQRANALHWNDPVGDPDFVRSVARYKSCRPCRIKVAQRRWMPYQGRIIYHQHGV